jgi:chaperone required for assembly of F1-ATPase
MKRFYKNVTVEKCGPGWGVFLDGKPVRLPDRTFLVIQNQNLADEIAREWHLQGDEIAFHAMPIMQIVSTALITDQAMRTDMTDRCLAYLDTDLIFYRTDNPPDMAQAQAKAWDRWVKWFSDLSGVTLETTRSLKALRQPRAAHDLARRILESYDIWRFTAAQIATSATGSLVLALAFTLGDADENDLFDASQVEETYRDQIYNAALHGPDPMIEKKQFDLRRDLSALRLILRLTQKSQ